MFWTFILIIALALTFVRLGAYSVLVSVLSGSLQLALLAIAALTRDYLAPSVRKTMI